MTPATVRRHIAAAAAALTVTGRTARVAACRNGLVKLNDIAGAAWEAGMSDRLDAVCADLRAELAWIDECRAARSAHVAAPVSGFAAEVRLAAAMAGR